MRTFYLYWAAQPASKSFRNKFGESIITFKCEFFNKYPGVSNIGSFDLLSFLMKRGIQILKLYLIWFSQLFLILQFQIRQKVTAKPPKTIFDGTSGLSNRQLNAYRQTMIEDDSSNIVITSRPEEDFDVFNPFEGEDEWSIRATLTGFNKDKSKLRSLLLLVRRLIKHQLRRFQSNIWYYNGRDNNTVLWI